MKDEVGEVKDPVCGMKLTPEQVKESLDFGGRTSRFCSVGCRAEFERHPRDYTGSSGAGESPHV